MINSVNSTIGSAAVAQDSTVELSSTGGIVTTQPTAGRQASDVAADAPVAVRSNATSAYRENLADYEESPCRRAAHDLGIWGIGCCGVGHVVMPILACAQAGNPALVITAGVSYGCLAVAALSFCGADKPSPQNSPRERERYDYSSRGD